MKKIYTSIDIGSDSIKILVAELVKNSLNVLAQTDVRSNGIKKGLIVDANECLMSIKEAINNIEGKLGIKIDKVIASIPAYYADYEIVSGYSTITSEEKKVTGNDITRALQACVYNKINENKELITLIPIDISVDENKNVKDPKDLVGNKLEVKAMMVTTPKKNVYSIISIMQSLGIEVVDINLGSIADYNEYRTKDTDKMVGAIINIGGETTTISLFNKGIIVKSEVLQIGGKNIDNDISYVFKLNKNDSRKLKETFSVAHKRFSQVNEVYETLNVNKDLIKITQYDLSQVVMSRITEILKLAKKQTFLLTNKEIHYIIITGGTSELPGITYLIDEIFGNETRIGNMETVGIRNNKYSTVSGLLRCFDDKLKLRGKEYSMFNAEDEGNISSPKKKLNFSNDSVLGKVFGYFFDN
jgi:cell division protein FtsA